MSSKSPKIEDYKSLISEIKQRIRSGQYAALRAVNKELIALYWDIGSTLSLRSLSEKWGKSLVQNLSLDLQNEFPDVSGFSASNLWRMKLFYEAYSSELKLAPLVREIGWSHNLLILERCKDSLEREFYIRMTKKMGWSKSVLIHQIDNKSYEKTLLNQTNFKKTLPEKIQNQASLAIKDEYTFDFLELAEEHNERELEKSLLQKMDLFLREMGGALTFVGSQYRLEAGNKEYFIDILLYHRHLKCLVAIELKIGEFLPEYVGKMQFYLAVLDDKIKTEDENPSIGIIVCRSKEETIVEYALKESKKPIGVSSYKIVTKLPKDLKKELPSAEQIKMLLKEIE